MSFLDKMKAATGVGGGPEFAVDVNQRPTKRGEELIATVRLIPAKVPQKLNFVGINVEWEGEWIYKNADGGDVLVKGRGYYLNWMPEQYKGYQLQPGQTIELPVRVKIPSDAPLTSDGKVKYKFYMRADVEGAADPTFETPIEIRG